MEIDAETNQKIQDLQMMEQNFQSLLVQKQTFQLESNEIKNALEEVTIAKGDIFQVLGQVMVKSDKDSILKSLKEKKDLLDLRLKALDKQELSFRENVERMRNEIVSKLG